MSRARSGKVVLDTTVGTTTGDKIHCAYDSAVLHIGYRITASAAFTATTSLAFLGCCDPVDDTASALYGVEHVTVPDAGVTFTAGSISAGSNVALLDVTAGADGVFRIVNPPPIVIPVFTRNGGGGTFRVRLKAWV